MEAVGSRELPGAASLRGRHTHGLLGLRRGLLCSLLLGLLLRLRCRGRLWLVLRTWRSPSPFGLGRFLRSLGRRLGHRGRLGRLGRLGHHRLRGRLGHGGLGGHRSGFILSHFLLNRFFLSFGVEENHKGNAGASRVYDVALVVGELEAQVTQGYGLNPVPL